MITLGTKTGSILLVLTAFMLAGCGSVSTVYKAYPGPVRSEHELAVVEGARFIRSDWINRLTDAIRFLSIDGSQVENPEAFNSVLVEPGVHDLTVYFSWDTGSQRGLAPALINYAATRNNLSRTLRLTMEPGKSYIVQGEPVFRGQVQDITRLEYVDFWVEDSEGNIVVTREEGAYLAVP